MRVPILCSLLLANSLVAAEARAQAGWIDGTFQFEPGLACVTWNPETTVTSYAGYWGTLDASFPKTGDVSYVRGVAAVVGNPCAGADAIGFEFDLPKGAVTAVSAQNPVVCVATRLSDGLTTTTESNIHCSQTATAGAHGGMYFGYAVVPSGWMFEIRVPVQFQEQLLGMGGPAADNLKVGVDTTNDFRVAEAWVTVPYRALVTYPSPSVTFLGGGNNYRMTTTVSSFFKTGTVKFEVGSSSGIYDDGVIYSYAITTPGAAYDVYTDGAFGAYTGPVYWRAFYETASGTFYGAEQFFTANGTTPGTYALTVSKAGAGGGTVTSNPQGVRCGGACSASFTASTVVALTATAEPGAEFAGWSGACTGTGACNVTMSSAQAVTATFSPASAPLNGTLDVQASGCPGGSSATIAVTGPSGFSQQYTLGCGTGQTLSSAPAGQYTGVAADVSAAGVTYVASPRTLLTGIVGGGRGVLAASYVVGRRLTVTKSGAGTGTVVSNPGGVDCGASCAPYLPQGTAVTLTAAPAAGSVFAGWSGGGCSGTGTCQVALSADQTVTATFDPAPAGTVALTVALAGTGFGAVTSSPAGIDCGATCNHNFTSGTAVTLTATPTGSSVFAGWSGGGCSGTGACQLTVSAATTVTATFAPPGTTGPSDPLVADPTDSDPKDSNDGGGCAAGEASALGALAALWLTMRRYRGRSDSTAQRSSRPTSRCSPFSMK